MPGGLTHCTLLWVALLRYTPAAGAEAGGPGVQGLSAPRVQLERLERAKQHRAASQMHAQLPRLARLLDYLCVSLAVAALDDGLADLRALLTNTGVLNCRVRFQEEAKGLHVDPAEAAVAVAITKQVLPRATEATCTATCCALLAGAHD